MMNEKKEVYSENPEQERWQLLLRLSYPNNIKKYYKQKGIPEVKQEIIDVVSSSFQQASEYFSAANVVSLNISPLLLYYGATNLLIATANLILPDEIQIENHGMQIIIPPKQNQIADIEIKIRDPKRGAFTNLNKIFGTKNYNTIGEKYSLIEVLGSILELKDDFENIYESSHSYALPLQKILKKDEVFYRLNKNELSRFNGLDEILSLIPNFSKNYLAPAVTQNHNYVVFRKKLNGVDSTELSLSEQNYFSLSFRKNNTLITIPIIIRMLLGLYGLGFLSRYHPNIWAPFIRTDSTGEKQIIEKFINLTKSYLPNLCLEYLYGKKFAFVKQVQNTLDLSQKTFKEEIQELIQREIINNLDKMGIKKI